MALLPGWVLVSELPLAMLSGPPSAWRWELALTVWSKDVACGGVAWSPGAWGVGSSGWETLSGLQSEGSELGSGLQSEAPRACHSSLRLQWSHRGTLQSMPGSSGTER